MSEQHAVVAGAFITWDAHIGSHFCPVADGSGACESGSAFLGRLHLAVGELTASERGEALAAVRAWLPITDVPEEA